MAQSSGPIAQGTAAERQMTDVLWRNIFGDEPGVVGDLDGSAYKVTLPTDSDIAQVGSASQASLARVAGFSHSIPINSPEPITIPAALDVARTDILALRYDPAHTGAPGPVRLVRIAGTSSGLPVYDASPPGIEDLPLWAITRRPGEALSQATVKQLFPRLTRSLDLPVGAPLPLSSPLGTTLQHGPASYRRERDVAGNPVWRRRYGDAIIGHFNTTAGAPNGDIGTSPQTLTGFQIPDPGVPFRPQMVVGVEFGSKTAGTRWDLDWGFGDAGGGLIRNSLGRFVNLERPGEEAVRWHFATGVMGPVTTGSQLYRLVARRVYGDGLGRINATNFIFQVTYWAA